jgi:hypothetical protein
MLQSVEKIGDGVQIIYVYTIEIKDSEKPACAAEFIARVY